MVGRVTFLTRPLVFFAGLSSSGVECHFTLWWSKNNYCWCLSNLGFAGGDYCGLDTALRTHLKIMSEEILWVKRDKRLLITRSVKDHLKGCLSWASCTQYRTDPAPTCSEAFTASDFSHSAVGSTAHRRRHLEGFPSFQALELAEEWNPRFNEFTRSSSWSSSCQLPGRWENRGRRHRRPPGPAHC